MIPTLRALEPDLRTYEAKRPSLLANARGKFVLIRSGAVIGTFDARRDALNEGYRRFGVVPFLVKQVTESEPTESIS